MSYSSLNLHRNNSCFQTVVLKKTLESPLGCKEIKPHNPKGNKPWIFIGRTEAEAEVPILWPPDAKSWLIRKDPDSRKDWRQEEKGTTEDELVGRHHRLNGHEFAWTPGVGDGQGGLACCGSWGRKESDTTERLNWTELLQSAWLWPVDALKAVFHAPLVRVWGFWVNHSISDAYRDCST